MATLKPSFLALLLLHITTATSYILLYPVSMNTNATKSDILNTLQDHCYRPHQTIESGEPTKFDCRNAIASVLSSPSARAPQYFTGIPLGIIEHWTSGSCHIDFQPESKESRDVFSLTDVASVAAVVVGECVGEEAGRLGGWRSVGGKGAFRVSVQYNYSNDYRRGRGRGW